MLSDCFLLYGCYSVFFDGCLPFSWRYSGLALKLWFWTRLRTLFEKKLLFRKWRWWKPCKASQKLRMYQKEEGVPPLIVDPLNFIANCMSKRGGHQQQLEPYISKHKTNQETIHLSVSPQQYCYCISHILCCFLIVFSVVWLFSALWMLFCLFWRLSFFFLALPGSGIKIVNLNRF